MASEVAGPAGTLTSEGTPGPGPVSAAGGRPAGRPWWLLAVLAAVVALVVGAVADHILDQRSAAVSLYRAQINTTLARFGLEADRQLGRPVSQRSASAFGDLGDSIGQDSGVNGSGDLSVEFGTGSVQPAGQIAFAVTVSSSHAATTLVVWDIRTNGSVNQGVCALSSTLAGSGRVTQDVQLGGSQYLQPCESRWWTPGPVDGTQPRLSLAGIPNSPPIEGRPAG
jgi:hypothetical protein